MLFNVFFGFDFEIFRFDSFFQEEEEDVSQTPSSCAIFILYLFHLLKVLYRVFHTINGQSHDAMCIVYLAINIILFGKLIH